MATSMTPGLEPPQQVTCWVQTWTALSSGLERDPSIPRVTLGHWAIIESSQRSKPSGKRDARFGDGRTSSDHCRWQKQRWHGRARHVRDVSPITHHTMRHERISPSASEVVLGHGTSPELSWCHYWPDIPSRASMPWDSGWLSKGFPAM